MEFSQNTNELFVAFAKFQAECPQVTKDASVNVKKNGQFQYKFDYATLGNIIRTAKPHLAKHNLSVLQNLTKDGVQTIITHSSGQWMKSGYLPILLTTEVKNGSNVNTTEQEMGSSATYKKRYQLAAMLLQDAEDDEDGNVATGNEPEVSKKRTTPTNGTSKNGKSVASQAVQDTKKQVEQEQDDNVAVETKEAPKGDGGKDDAQHSNVDGVQATIDSFATKKDLIEWWKGRMDDDSDGSFRSEWQPKVFAKLEELK